jgi:hypothetical protein
MVEATVALLEMMSCEDLDTLAVRIAEDNDDVFDGLLSALERNQPA